MIKAIALVITVFNPANDKASSYAIGPYTLDECLIVERNMYDAKSPMMIEIKKNKLELVASRCD